MALYYPKIFDVTTMQEAKQIILTAEPGTDTESRWAIETPYVMELIAATFDPHPDMIVLDYGCGIGRLAKTMIDAWACSVIGVDTSPRMRALSIDYVGSDRFLAVSAAQFDTMVRAGLRVDATIAVWVLQHCFAPGDDIARIQRALTPEARGFVLNMPTRAIPAVNDTSADRMFWASDEIDVAKLLRAAFHVINEGAPDKIRTPNMADVGAFWMSFRNQPEPPSASRP